MVIIKIICPYCKSENSFDKAELLGKLLTPKNSVGIGESSNSYLDSIFNFMGRSTGSSEVRCKNCGKPFKLPDNFLGQISAPD